MEFFEVKFDEELIAGGTYWPKCSDWDGGGQYCMQSSAAGKPVALQNNVKLKSATINNNKIKR